MNYRRLRQLERATPPTDDVIAIVLTTGMTPEQERRAIADKRAQLGNPDAMIIVLDM